MTDEPVVDQVITILKRIGTDRFNEICNIAKIAIEDDGYREEQRLTFANNVQGLHRLSQSELVAVFMLMLWEFNNNKDKDRNS